MITPMTLIDELKSFIKEVVKEYSLETKSNDKREPKVYTGFLPAKGKEESDFPFILLRLIEAGDKEELEATAQVKIIVGTYSIDEQEGWRDPANILHRLYIELGKRETIARKYRLERPIRYKVEEEQPYPQWFGEMETTWTIQRPVLEPVYYKGVKT